MTLLSLMQQAQRKKIEKAERALIVATMRRYREWCQVMGTWNAKSASKAANRMYDACVKLENAKKRK